MRLFRQSAKGMKQPRNLVTVAMLTAVGIVLSAYATVRILPDFQVSFGFLSSALIAQLFGPIPNIMAGVVTDVLSYLLFTDGPYCFWFALNPVISGFIFSFFFYRKSVTVSRAVLAKVTDTLVVEIGMTTFWLMLLYGSNGWAWFLARAAGKLAACLLQIPVLYLVTKTTETIKNRIF